MSTLSSAVSTLQLFAEPTRVRLMALLEAEELTVAELVTITELAQSSVSTHLGKLRDARPPARPAGGRLHALRAQRRHHAGRREAGLVAECVARSRTRCSTAIAVAAPDVLKARERASAWPDTVAGQMERHYSPGRTWEATARGLFG